MFKLNPAPTFKATVDVSQPGDAPSLQLEVVFRHRGRAELVALMDDIANSKQAGKTDDDVQTQRQKDIEDGKIKDTHPGLAAQRSDKGQCDQGSGDQGNSRGRPEKWGIFHARSPVFSPNSPEGLNISTTISTTKAKMS